MEALTNAKEKIDSPDYLKVKVPIRSFLLFLTGVGSADRLAQKFVRQPASCVSFR
jgi:hypothetical protein